MKSLLIFMYASGLTIVCLLTSNCTSVDKNKRDLSSVDTVQLIQTVLSDKLLESEIRKDFGDQEFKLVTNNIVRIGQKFTFFDKSVMLIPVSGDMYQIHQNHPKELYVSVNSIKIFSSDSVSVLLIFHAGNATVTFFLKKNQKKWTILKRQYGKF